MTFCLSDDPLQQRLRPHLKVKTVSRAEILNADKTDKGFPTSWPTLGTDCITGALPKSAADSLRKTAASRPSAASSSSKSTTSTSTSSKPTSSTSGSSKPNAQGGAKVGKGESKAKGNAKAKAKGDSGAVPVDDKGGGESMNLDDDGDSMERDEERLPGPSSGSGAARKGGKSNGKRRWQDDNNDQSAGSGAAKEEDEGGGGTRQKEKKAKPAPSRSAAFKKAVDRGLGPKDDESSKGNVDAPGRQLRAECLDFLGSKDKGVDPKGEKERQRACDDPTTAFVIDDPGKAHPIFLFILTADEKGKRVPRKFWVRRGIFHGPHNQYQRYYAYLLSWYSFELPRLKADAEELPESTPDERHAKARKALAHLVLHTLFKCSKEVGQRNYLKDRVSASPASPLSSPR